jgi:putative glycosyltransferase (TIGR04372 family)
MEPKHSIDLLYHTPVISNEQLKKMWDRTLPLYSWVARFDKANRRLPGWGAHWIAVTDQAGRDVHGLLDRFPPHLSFTLDEERQGRDALRRLGIPEGAPFVCFHSRDSAYLETTYPENTWSQHDYRDSIIHHYVPAAEQLVLRGNYAIRMGNVVKEHLRSDNSKIIDYAVTGRSDFMDIYLPANCKFFLGSAVGIVSVAEVFRRPVAWANFIPIGELHTANRNDLFILKKLWIKKDRRFMTFREMVFSGVGGFLYSHEYERLGLEVVENTPEEITPLAVEMDERLNGTWQSRDEDDELQRRFREILQQSDRYGEIYARIGAKFLRENRDLLN